MPELNEFIPKVSIILPTYNRGVLLENTVKNILSQTYRDFEIIIVDDNSNDNTKEVVTGFSDKRIVYIKHKNNQGAPIARNTGIKAAKGEYIAFQDSDDEWLPEKLEKQVRAIESASKNVGVVYTAFLRVANGKTEYIPYPWVIKKEGNIHSELLKGSFITTPSIMVRKECFEKAGMFDERLPRLQDYELVLRLAKYYDFIFIDEPLLIQPCMPDSISNSEPARIKALQIIVTKHYDDFLKDKVALSNYYFGIGKHLCLDDRENEGHEYLVKAFELIPDKKNLSRHYSILGRRLCKKNINQGRAYLRKALNMNPFNFEAVFVLLLSFLGKTIYDRVLTTYKKNEYI